MPWEGLGLSPGLVDVFDQRLGLVLHQQVDSVNFRIHQAAENKIGDSISTSEWYSGLGSLRRQWVQSCSLTTGHDHS